MAPVAYVLQARLRQAQHLLLTTPDTVAGVAARSGFASSYYFCRVFRRQFQTTPTAFRRETGIRGRPLGRQDRSSAL